jgi:uncharacterized membrane protein (DUF4010 family)
MAVASTGAAAWFGLRSRHGGEAPSVALRNPFSLWEAVKFGLLFAAVLLAVELGRRYLDDRALYGIAALAGTTDVDAITLSMADLSKSTLAPSVATVAIVIAAISNTVVKCSMAGFAGSRALAYRVGGATAAICVVGVVAAVLGLR